MTDAELRTRILIAEGKADRDIVDNKALTKAGLGLRAIMEEILLILEPEVKDELQDTLYQRRHIPTCEETLLTLGIMPKKGGKNR